MSDPTGIQDQFKVVPLSYKMATILRTYTAPLRTLVVILVITGLEVATDRLVFVCPCLEKDQDRVPVLRLTYSLLFITVPIFVLFLLGVILREKTWRCITGWKVQHKFRYPGRSCSCFFKVILSSLLAPITWLVLVFISGRYLECTWSTLPDSCLGGLAAERVSQIQKENAELRALSQLIGLATFAGTVFLCLIAWLLGACCSNMTYYQNLYAKRHLEVERLAFELAAEETLQRELRGKWKVLFRKGRPSDWCDVSELEPVNPGWEAEATPSGGIEYSPLQNWQGAGEEVNTEVNMEVNTEVNGEVISYTREQSPPPAYEKPARQFPEGAAMNHRRMLPPVTKQHDPEVVHKKRKRKKARVQNCDIPPQLPDHSQSDM